MQITHAKCLGNVVTIGIFQLCDKRNRRNSDRRRDECEYECGMIANTFWILIYDFGE